MSLTGNDLKAMGWPANKTLGMALSLMETECAELSAEEQIGLLRAILEAPAEFAEDARFATLVAEMQVVEEPTIALNEQPAPYQIYGAVGIEQGALDQMEIAMKLPITIAGALMPDAHQGYGLPIGGVLATRNAVIPYGVGVDIGCRMCMTVYNLPASMLEEKREDLKKMLVRNTYFGRQTANRNKDHEIFARSEFDEIPVVKNLKRRAVDQIGSSGGGNHFVEFGIVDITSPINEFNLAPGQYVALLSHSGSRGFGSNIAGHYTKLAMDMCKLPKEAKHLAWLDLDTEAGQEYWLAMNLAGDYASACHHQIHERMAIGLRETPLAMIENHHNFAWKEKDAEGNEMIVHRKGATPAGDGVLGIIPGSMATPGYIVRGRGMANSINSAAHGAGRTMSRTKAKQNITKEEMYGLLQQNGVEVIGSGLDEAPMAYKDIHQVMDAQRELVEVLGSFMPKIVRMCGDARFKEVD